MIMMPLLFIMYLENSREYELSKKVAVMPSKLAEVENGVDNSKRAMQLSRSIAICIQHQKSIRDGAVQKSRQTYFTILDRTN